MALIKIIHYLIWKSFRGRCQMKVKEKFLIKIYYSKSSVKRMNRAMVKMVDILLKLRPWGAWMSGNGWWRNQRTWR